MGLFPAALNVVIPSLLKEVALKTLHENNSNFKGGPQSVPGDRLATNWGCWHFSIMGSLISQFWDLSILGPLNYEIPEF